MSNNIYGIDFGTCNFKVFSKSSGKVVSEKNTIAIINKTQIYAYLNFFIKANFVRKTLCSVKNHLQMPLDLELM